MQPWSLETLMFLAHTSTEVALSFSCASGKVTEQPVVLLLEISVKINAAIHFGTQAAVTYALCKYMQGSKQWRAENLQRGEEKTPSHCTNILSVKP